MIVTGQLESGGGCTVVVSAIVLKPFSKIVM
jgi:hypothetical protein